MPKQDADNLIPQHWEHLLPSWGNTLDKHVSPLDTARPPVFPGPRHSGIASITLGALEAHPNQLGAVRV